MKTKLLLPLIALSLSLTGHSATVLGNITGTVSTNQAVKGPGGVIPTPVQYGLEFTVNGVDHDLDSITLVFGNTFGTQPLLVELFASPAGPNSATFLTAMTGPTNPSNQNAVYTPATPQTLAGGATYFLKLYVANAGGLYSLSRTSEPLTGSWSLDDVYLSNGGAWNTTGAPYALFDIQASPVPEPAASLLGALGCLILLRRRR